MGPPRSTSNSSDFFSEIGHYIEFSKMESKSNFAKVHGPWWTQIKVVLIQKGLLDNQNPDFCMGWPGLYFLDNIDQLGTVCFVQVSSLELELPTLDTFRFCEGFG